MLLPFVSIDVECPSQKPKFFLQIRSSASRSVRKGRSRAAAAAAAAATTQPKQVKKVQQQLLRNVLLCGFFFLCSKEESLMMLSGEASGADKVVQKEEISDGGKGEGPEGAHYDPGRLN